MVGCKDAIFPYSGHWTLLESIKNFSKMEVFPFFEKRFYSFCRHKFLENFGYSIENLVNFTLFTKSLWLRPETTLIFVNLFILYRLCKEIFGKHDMFSYLLFLILISSSCFSDFFLEIRWFSIAFFICTLLDGNIFIYVIFDFSRAGPGRSKIYKKMVGQSKEKPICVCLY